MPRGSIAIVTNAARQQRRSARQRHETSLDELSVAGVEQAPVTLGIDRVGVVVPVVGTPNVAPSPVYVGPWTFTLALS